MMGSDENLVVKTRADFADLDALLLSKIWLR